VIALPEHHRLRRAGRAALVAGAAAALASLVGAVLDPDQFARSYLVAYLYWTGAATGALAILLIYHVTGGAWGTTVRRFLEACVRLLPALGVLFLPIALLLPHLYAWARADGAAQDASLAHQHVYLNVPFFLVRTAFYFATWIALSRALLRWSAAQDATTDPRPGERLELVSRGGLVLMGLTMTFASIDWMMSLEPRWTSTIYGVVFMGGSAITALALGIVLAAGAWDEARFADVVRPEQFHDLGKLLLAFTMLWAYFAFSQFLIIWSGNLPEEIPWYLARLRHGWLPIAVAVLVFHFALPFAVLLSATVKRRPGALAVVAGGLLAARAVDVYWTIAPAFHPEGPAPHWLDVATLVALGGLFLGAAVRALDGRSLLPLHDPSLPIEAEQA
jgi:hypothetical protein